MKNGGVAVFSFETLDFIGARVYNLFVKRASKDGGRYKMNDKKEKKAKRVRAGKECAYLAVVVAILIVAQLCFSAIPSVEVVTVLFLSYAFVFGAKRGMLAATAFSLLRVLVFGFYPTIFLTYLVYFNLAALLFGWLGRMVKKPLASLWWLTLLACLCTLSFTALDGVITPLWYGMRGEAWLAYFLAGFPIALPQTLCTAVTIALLFLPVTRAFRSAKRGL